MKPWPSLFRQVRPVVREVQAHVSGPCEGHGLRALSDRSAPAAFGRRHCLIENTRQAGVHLLGVDAGAFWSQIQDRVDAYEDVGVGVLKSIVFGVSVSLMGVFEGFYAAPTAAGVSRAATRTVVITSVWILLLDFVITGLTLPEV